VYGDVRVEQPELAVLKARVGVDELDAVIAQALDLGAKKHHACLVTLVHEVIMERLAVARDDLISAVLWA
jgi:hypothetical protein